MINEMEITSQEEVLTLVCRKTISPYDLKKELTNHLPTIYQTIVENGKEVIGMPFSMYHIFDDDKFEVEIGMPVSGEFKVNEPYSFSKIPQQKIAKAQYFGPYGKLDEGYDDLAKWAKKEGNEVTVPYWEIYVSDPMEVEDISKLRTDIHMSIK